MVAYSETPAENSPRCFLTDGNIQKAIQDLVWREGDLRVAVAYWGERGAQHTGIEARVRTHPGKAYIICDLASGACNPSEIEKLWKGKGNIQIKTLDDLHAKVWIAEDRVIVGSANASISGLADETKLGSKIEAALLVQDPKLAQTLKKWFERLWSDAAPITEKRLRKAKDSWNPRRKAGAPSQPTPAELSGLRKRLLARVVETGEYLWRSDKRPDITLRSIRSCQNDRDWLRSYHDFVGKDQATQKERKRSLHPWFGITVREHLGAKSGKRGMNADKGDLIGSYTELHPG